jgi:cyclopropane fatty-acyl-phospholipid synthase-like methyltransferase
MTPAELYDEEQRARWNGADGEYWTTQQARLDRTLAPVSDALLAFAEPVAGSTVIDVGCGCGATTIEFARAVGPAGRVVGVDLSEPMLAVAKERLRGFPNTAFQAGDAATV